MSLENDKGFNIPLILTAGIVDAAWYFILTLLVTSKIALEFFKNKNILLKKFVCSIFIIIGALLFLELLI